MKHSVHLVLSLLLIGIVNQALCQTCCTGGVPVTGNLNLESLDNKKLSVNIRYDHNNINTLILNNEVLDDDQLSRKTRSVVAQISYTPINKLYFHAIIPYSFLSEKVDGARGSLQSNNNGVGDITALASYTLVNIEKLNVNIGIGVKLPTGSTKSVNENDLILPPTLQIGTGTTDMIGIAQFNWTPFARKSITLSQTVSHKWNSESKRFASHQYYEFGDELLSYTSVTDQIVIGTIINNPILMLKFQHQQKNKIERSKDANSGGSWVYVVPGWGIQFTPSISSLAMVEIPAYRNINGFQLTTTYRFIISTRFKF